MTKRHKLYYVLETALFQAPIRPSDRYVTTSFIGCLYQIVLRQSLKVNEKETIWSKHEDEEKFSQTF
jgi:hypothetical protein